MQYVRSISGSVSKTWNSINPATLSGAIDVIVVEQQDGSLACSPFHVRFGKFSLLRPYEKKVEFRVNDVKQDYAMKLGEGGEAFFVFETSDDIPEALQTSPLVSPLASPKSLPSEISTLTPLQEPEFLELDSDAENKALENAMNKSPRTAVVNSGNSSPSSASPENASSLSGSRRFSNGGIRLGSPFERSVSDPNSFRERSNTTVGANRPHMRLESHIQNTSRVSLSVPRSNSPPPLPTKEAVDRARSLSKKLSISNIPTKVNETGDLMLDMTGYKTSEDDTLRAEIVARKILSEEIDGSYDIGALIGADEHGNLWIYSSEEAKEAASRKATLHLPAADSFTSDAVSDPGYQSDGDRSPELMPLRARTGSELEDLVTPPKTPPEIAIAGDPNRNYAKTLRLTSDQLMALGLKAGANSMSFSVNKATCAANMYYWKYDVPVVISDIDGTITKSDALGHVLNMIGRDWTHLGVAKLYSDIVANGYHIMYLTSRSVGQADTTRAYLNGVIQENYKLPKGPVIMSPDRTIAALRREVYLRKPEVFKMACLRDILNLFSKRNNPFYAGFGNRLTDALSYRSVNIPSTRIFTINSNAEVVLDLLTFNTYKSTYVNMRELVDHFFPPVSMLVPGGAEEFTDFNYWRVPPLNLDDFSASESDEDERNDKREADEESYRSEDEGSEVEDYEQGDDMGQSYISKVSNEEAIDPNDETADDSADEEDAIPDINERGPNTDGADYLTEQLSKIAQEQKLEANTDPTVITTDDIPELKARARAPDILVNSVNKLALPGVGAKVEIESH
ncbi:MAG: hypothetical protein M1829_006288 [Trizodia sp. TS-e1964]|nr:MAG: hypothetical protein M1829_006288 [Trizodia sp. TS-e1964]